MKHSRTETEGEVYHLPPHYWFAAHTMNLIATKVVDLVNRTGPFPVGSLV